jgi:hypothetical protein
MAHPSVPFSTARRHPDLVFGNPQGEEVAATRAGTFPLFPVVQPHSTANPFGQCHHLVIGVADAKVVESSGDVAAQLVYDVLHPMSPVASCDFAHPLFEAHVGLFSPHHPTACADPKTHKRALPKRRGLALVPVDHQPKPSLDKPRKPRHHPLGRLRTPDHDQEVVRIAGETVPSAFEFLVQGVERDIGQQWRKHSPNAKGNFEFVKVLRYRQGRK